MTASTFWLLVAGSALLITGIVTTRKRLAAAPLADKLIALGPAFVAAPVVLFGAERLISAFSVPQGQRCLDAALP